ncbi:MAG: hypothetical protein AB7O97_18230 [Planctomycetota bacterium]
MPAALSSRAVAYSAPLLIAVFAAGVAAQDGDAAGARAAAWREDVQHVRQQWAALHPDPWHACAADAFDAACAAFVAAVPGWTDDRCLVELMRLVAQLGPEREGHAGVVATDALTFLPVQLHEFADGVFVVDAATAHLDLVGARVLRLGDAAIDDVLAAVDPLVPRDCAMNARVRRLPLAIAPPVLHALGLAPSRDRVVVRVQAQGATAPRDVTLVGAPFAERLEWSVPGLLPDAPRPDRPRPRHLTGRARAFRLETLADDGAVYVQYNRMDRQSERGETVRAFAERVLAAAAAPSARVIVDVRWNGGGDNTTYRPLLDALADAGCNRPGGLFVLMGRRTFSAAGNFVTEVERRTEAILVGEETGGSPNQFGDARTVPLPRHPALAVRIPTRYHEKAPGDPRLTHAPDLPVAYTAADWLAGRDPVLQAALRHRP